MQKNCKNFRYWKPLHTGVKTSMRACHYMLETGEPRPKPDCPGFPKKGGKQK